MKYCPKCGAELKENNHFCPKCGHEITFQKSETAPQAEKVKNNRPWLKNLIYVLLAIACVAYIYKTFIGPKIEPTVIEAQVDIDELTGIWIWNDPADVLEGNPESLLTMRSSDGQLIGQDENQKILIELRLQGKNKFTGHLTFNGIKTTADTEFDREYNKLTFKNKLSGLDWYIKKK